MEKGFKVEEYLEGDQLQLTIATINVDRLGVVNLEFDPDGLVDTSLGNEGIDLDETSPEDKPFFEWLRKKLEGPHYEGILEILNDTIPPYSGDED